MDNFMDKIAQKLGAQEAIRANAAAEAAQIERLEAQVAKYDACIQEIRKLNLRNTENEQKLKDLMEAVQEQLKLALEQNSRQLDLLVEEGSGKLEQMAEKGSARLEQVTEECMAKLQWTEQEAEDAETEGQEEEALKEMLEELKASLAENTAKVEEMFRQSNDFVHRENVKVYRNVQAATSEELEKKTQAVIDGQQELAGKNKKMYMMGILTLVVAIVNLGMLVAHLAGLF